MAAARYWRITGIQTYGGGDLELSELHLYAGGVRVDAGATLTCTLAPIEGAVADLQDANTTTKCRFAAASVRAGGFALTWDFVAPQSVSGVRIGTGSAQSVSISSLILEWFVGGLWVGEGPVGRYEYPGAESMLPIPAEGDPTFSNVALLLPADGADGSTTVVDQSPTPKIFTAQGHAALSTAKTLFGQATLRLDGNGDSIVAVPDSTLLFGTGDFTIGFWAWKSANGRDGYDRVIHTSYNADDGDGFLVELSSTRGLMMYGMGALLLNPIALDPNDSTWHHWEICRVAGVVYAFKDGALIGSQSSATNINLAAQLRIGARNNTSSSEAYYFNGYLYGLRIKRGEGLHSSAFPPPSGPYPVGSATGLLQDFPRTNRHGVVAAASSAGSAHSTPRVTNIQVALDVEFGGQGRIYGTTKTKGAPNAPTKARVFLLHQRSKMLVRETWSDPVTGYFEFTGMDISQQYLTLAEDAAGNFRPVAASRLTPEVPT